MQSNYFMEMYTMQSQSGQTQITAIPAINSHSVLTIPNITAIIEADAHTVTNTNAQTDSNTGSDANNSISPQGSVNILCSTILNPSSQHQHIHQRHEHHNNQNQQRCDNSFMNDDDDTISNHQHSHVCGMCGNTFRKTSGLKRHMRIHVIEQGLALKINNEGGSEHPYKCNACKVEYPNASSFEQHIQNEHTQPQALKCTQCGCFRPILLTSVSPFRCETCTDRTGDVFQSSGIIKYQITANVSNPVAAQQIHVTHSKAIKLEIPSLLQGIRLVEYGHARRPRKQHQCSECEKSYKHQSTLAMHKKVHSGEYKYKCEYCDKEFYLTEYYNRHMRVHTKEKPYRCDVCDKSFSQSNTLTQHKRIHTGKKLLELSHSDSLIC